MAWEEKVHKVIGKLAAQAYKQTNYDRQGHKYKKHRPYRLPEEADSLVKCLGDKDRVRGEHTCKEIMEGLRRSREEID